MLYQLLIHLLAPLIVALILWDAQKRKGGKTYISQRLGWGYKPHHPHRIWIHCASVGEVKSIEALVRSSSRQSFLITTNTPTGFYTATQLKLQNAELCYCPLDYCFAIKNFLNTKKPTELWVVETELWPNLYRLTAKQNIKITLINGRLSKKTLRAPNWIKQEYRACLSHVNKILTRSETERQHFIALGAARTKIEVIGNIKYSLLTNLLSYPRLIEQKYILLASSHANEEFEIAQRWLTLKRSEILVIVPRHAKRAQSIAKQLTQLNENILLISDNHDEHSSAVILVDGSYGRLMNWFAHADCVIMGGSFTPKGGHNFLEPAAFGKAVLTGPDNTDFLDELALFQQHNAIRVCQDYDALERQISQLMTNKAERETLGKDARHLISNQADILTRYKQSLGLKT